MQPVLYKNYVINENEILVDCPADFDIEEFDLDAYDAYVEKLLQTELKAERVVILHDHYKFHILTNSKDYTTDDVHDILQEIDLSENRFYRK